MKELKEEIFKEFYNYLLFDKNYSLNTINSYLTDVYDLLIFIKKDAKEEKILFNLKEQDIRDYLKHLNKNNINSRSIARKISTLKTYYKFLIITKKITNNP